MLVVAFDSATFADYADGYRTETALSLPAAVKAWRQDAWRLDDFYAQVRLGDLYSQNQSFATKESPKNPSFNDPVEAYVWYFMALRPDRDYSFYDNSTASQNLYDTRANAQGNARDVFNRLTFDQQLEARARLIYILSSRGAEGFMTLGRLHIRAVPTDNCENNYSDPQCGPPTVRLICAKSDYEEYLIPRIGWWIWTRFTSDPNDYPHRKIWRWVKRTEVDNYVQYPETYCDWQERPRPPETDTSYGSYQSSDSYPGSSSSYPRSYSGGNGPVQLSGPRTGNPLPYSSPSNLSSDPRTALRSSPTVSVGNTGAVSTTTEGPSGGSYPSSGSSDSGGGDYGDQIPSVFARNNAEALTYFRRADLLGHPLADAYTAALRDVIFNSDENGRRIIADAERRARYWTPRDEYYPGTTSGGLAHTDESLPTLEQRIALGRMRELPWSAVSEALDFRRYTRNGRGCGPPPICYRKPIEEFQGAFGYEQTGILTPPQAVRLIQMAAVAGDAVAQDRLGIMYAKGIGVPQNYPRAEMWFLNAANQNNADAMFNLYVLYKVGPNGIEHNEDKASIYNVRAMAIGYNRLLCELQDLLRQADDRRDRPGGVRRGP